MVDVKVVYEALSSSMERDSRRKGSHNNDPEEAGQVSLLIHDVFGGEILKTHNKKGWHFYNRIEGKRMDFTKSGIMGSSVDIRFEDILSTPDEIHKYFENEDYLIFFMKFVKAFEEAVGLDKYRSLAT